MSQKTRLVLSLILSVFCIQIIYLNNYMGQGVIVSADSIFSFAFFVILAIIFYKMFRYKILREYIIAFTVSLILSFSTCIGKEFITKKDVDLQSMDFFSAGLFFQILALTLIFTALLILLFNNIKNISLF